MSKATLIILWVLLLSSPRALGGARSDGWHEDILGEGFEAITLVQPADREGEPAPRATVVRYTADSPINKAYCGVLYIHGFNDYFYQSEMARKFAGKGYDFYAVDLRDYGRSIIKGRRPYDTVSLDSYFEDIEAALKIMEKDGVKEVILMGHSTGGLISAYFENSCHPAIIKALILNSPFLDWNQGWKETIIPAVSLLGRYFPNINISQGNSTAYFESLHKGAHGEWSFDPNLKKAKSPDVTLGWIRAITQAQNSLRHGKSKISVPILLMYSSENVSGEKWSEKFQHGDAVLDVNDIKKYGKQLGRNVTCVKVRGGLHDLVLSAHGVREPLYRYIFSWLLRQGLDPDPSEN